NGRMRFVKRYPDPEETEQNDTWDTLVDNPDLDPAALSLADQYSAKMEKARLLNLQQQPNDTDVEGGFSINMASVEVPKAETPLTIFPIKDPNESQIAIGDQLKQRRDFQRKMTKRVFLVIALIFLFLDLSQVWTISDMKSRIASGKMKSPNMIMVVDLGTVPDDYTPPDIKEMDKAVDAAVVDEKTGMTKEKGSIDKNITFKGTKTTTPHHWAMRPPPITREWIPEYPLPATAFILLLFLFKIAIPPLFAPRVRLRLYKDKLVAIPLTYPVQYKTMHFSDVVGIEIKGEETPSGTLYLRHRKFIKTNEVMDRSKPFKSVRGYLYSGLGDLGQQSPEDAYLVMLRCKSGVEDWGVQVQGMSVDRLRDLLDQTIATYWAEKVQTLQQGGGN
ncbi:hypothetical protein HDU99_007521, partial [Rhizoclosmatium hyalinum]